MGQVRFLLRLIELSGDKKNRLFWTSVCAGSLQGLLLYVMSASIEELATVSAVSLRNFLLFILCLAGLYRCLLASMSISSAVARSLITGFEVRISEKLSLTSYTHFQSIDQGAMYEAITGSKDIINESAIMLPIFISSLTMLACSLVFSFFISVAGLLAVLLVMGAAAAMFFYSDKNFIRALMEYRKAASLFQGTLKDIILGFTELKMNEAKRAGLFAEEINPRSLEVIARRVTADKHRVGNTVMYGLMVYFPVGALLYILPETGLANLEQSIKIVAITMFSTIPLIGLLSFMPLAARGAFIVASLESFEQSLDAMRDDGQSATQAMEDFVDIRIVDATFSYPKQDSGETQPFTLHIDDFSLHNGELVILRGGNGSGKSTFMHILAGLIPFTRGEILCNGKTISAMGPTAYRQYFSVVFPDFHIFSGLYGLRVEAEEVQSLLQQMNLSHKVTYNDQTKHFSTLALSSGQRKRLALACAILENRPILLFDEVAADFDHQFREYFYYTLLPSLKAQGRTVLAISHDDRYFSIADRVLTLQYGTLQTNNETIPA